MCGIFGFIANGGRGIADANADLDRGMQVIRHRGPDGGGRWISSDGRVGMGHVRLSIIDLESGDQPMISGDGRYVIVYNGEIYNYLE